MELVPTVDLSHPTPVAMDALDTACRDHGFFLLTGHGLDDLIDQTWAACRGFFALDRATKEGVRRTQEQPLGWYDRELTKRRRDRKEVFDFVDPNRPPDNDPNRWPDGHDDFRATMTAFFAAFGSLAHRVTALVHEALGVEASVAARHGGSTASSSVRLNRYTPGDPVPPGEREGLAEVGDVVLGHHTDPGVLTLLLQDDAGGLQALSADHGWIDVPPRPGTVVVNLADTMQVWTNDRYRASVHRVDEVRAEERFSIPFFFNPDRDTVIAPIDGIDGIDGAPNYRAFTWREFMRGRADDNYADLGVDDIQISRYRLAPA